MNTRRCFLALLSSFFFASFLGAQSEKSALSLASIFADHMVIQQQTDAAIWGRGVPGEKVLVQLSWTRGVGKAVVGEDGQWETTIKTPKAGGPFWINVISGDEKIELKDVLSGEVWICSGQSNMQWKMRGFGLDQFREDVEQAKYPNLRYAQVAQRIALDPQESVQTQWTVCNPKSVLDFSAVAYFFGSRLHQELDVPIGLISTNWGGSSVEAWIREETLKGDFPEFNSALAKFPGLKEQFGVLHSKSKKLPKGLNQRVPTVLYNGMIHPLIPFTFKGVIWYQGESNVQQPLQYQTLFPTMIRDWRAEWAQGDFPFYYVQIAPFNYKTNPMSAAFLREAQSMALAEPNTGMAVTMDIGNPTNIHPKEKKPVGERLARLALAKDYGHDGLVYSGPVYADYTVEGARVRLKLEYVGGGLVSRDGAALSHFTVAGKDQKFYSAKAVIEGDEIVVESAEVPQPVAVRFAWGSADEPNLSNQEGLPASSFRTDAWPIE